MHQAAAHELRRLLQTRKKDASAWAPALLSTILGRECHVVCGHYWHCCLCSCGVTVSYLTMSLVEGAIDVSNCGGLGAWGLGCRYAMVYCYDLLFLSSRMPPYILIYLNIVGEVGGGLLIVPAAGA